MWQIAAVVKDEKGAILEVLVDFQTTLGRTEDEAKMKFTLRNAEVLKGKEVSLILNGPFH